MLLNFMDFLFHELSEEERAEIQNQAKRILDDFSKKLGEGRGETEDPFIERDVCEREEKEGKKETFSREIMFENASEKNSDFIIAERKKW